MTKRTGAQQGGVSARQAAMSAFREAMVGGLHVHEHVRTLQNAERIDGRDASLAMEIALGAVGHANTIRHILSRCADYDDRRVDQKVRAILYTAVYQLVWLDRIPDFAAVNEAVELARSEVSLRSGGLVNAILRNVTRGIENKRVTWERLNPKHVRVSWDTACAFNREVLPPATNVERHLAAATGELPSRFEKLAALYGIEAAEAAAWAMQAVAPVTFQRNTLAASPAKFAEALAGVSGAEIDGDTAYVPASTSTAALPGFNEGLFYVQDTTAHQAVAAMRARPGERVLDLCAAPGGKSIALACAMRDQGHVVACDVSNERLSRVRSNVSRLQLTSVWALLLENGNTAKLSGMEPFDGVLADVPCSNTGVIARRPEARHTLTDMKLQSLVELQGRLIRVAAGCVRVGGRLVYSTCSIEPSENEEIIKHFTHDNDSWQLDEMKTTLPAWTDRPSQWRDGGFVARLTRVK